MHISFKTSLMATHEDGSMLIARESPQGWYWEMNGVPVGVVVSKENLGMMGFVKDVKKVYITETAYVVENADDSNVEVLQGKRESP